MSIKYSTTCMHRRTNARGGLLPLAKRETPAREAARALRIEARAHLRAIKEQTIDPS